MDRVANPFALLQPRVVDDHPRVRLEAVRALSFSNDSSAAASLALDVLGRPMDSMIEYTLNETLRQLNPRDVLLDKSPEAIAFQLARLSNPKLLALPRSSEDKRFLPIHRAILTRTGIPALPNRQRLKR